MNFFIKLFDQFTASKTIRLVFMLCLGICILILRNPDPIINLVIYTEDGQWIGRALRNGWQDAFINAKDGYFVWGNLALLWASVITSEVICNDPLICIPEGIAFYSYLTFSCLAVLVFYSTRSVISFNFLEIILIPTTIDYSNNYLIFFQQLLIF